VPLLASVESMRTKYEAPPPDITRKLAFYLHTKNLQYSSSTHHTMAGTATLTALTPREAVADALYRAVLGIDSNNRELFESACLKDESMTFSAGQFNLKGWSQISDLFVTLSKVVTTHITSNIRVEVKDDTASMTASAVAYHVKEDEAFKPEDTSYTAYNLYDIDLVKDDDDGLWKIKRWEIKALWTTGHASVVYG
jgi:hypothetical protein